MYSLFWYSTDSCAAAWMQFLMYLYFSLWNCNRYFGVYYWTRSNINTEHCHGLSFLFIFWFSSVLFFLLLFYIILFCYFLIFPPFCPKNILRAGNGPYHMLPTKTLTSSIFLFSNCFIITILTTDLKFLYFCSHMCLCISWCWKNPFIILKLFWVQRLIILLQL